MNKILREDIEDILASNLPFELLKNKKIMITGATGFIGSLLAKTLLTCNIKFNLNLTVLATVRNVDKAKIIFKDFDNKNLKFIKWDILEDKLEYKDKIDFIIHTATNTKSKEMVEYPVENLKTSILGTIQLLDFSISNSIEKFIYISSMEMYGTLNNQSGLTTENQLGYIDLKNVRSCYPEGKRVCECLCNSYHQQYQLKVNCVRLAQTFGAGTSISENRIFAQFAKSVIEKKDIILHTNGNSEGNYVYSSDAIKAILLILFNGNDGETYNVANMTSHMSIRDMANLVCNKIANNEIKVKYEIPNSNIYGYAPETKLYLCSEKLMSLGWNPEINLTQAYKKYISYLKEEFY